MLKDSNLNLPEGQPVEATLKVGDEPFSAFSTHVLGHDEISIFSQHGAAFTACRDNFWLGPEDSNLRMVESKSTASLGNAPTPATLGI